MLFAMDPLRLPRLLTRRASVFYGWFVLAALCCAGFARQGAAVATLSVFVEPLTREFGWSRAGLSGAVSLGGVLAAVTAPMIGPVLDRHGARRILCAAVLVNAAALMALALAGSLAFFYLFFCIARLSWAAPLDLGLYSAVNNWFVRRRAFATSLATLAQMTGLVTMPLIAQLAMLHQGWRAGWRAMGAVTLAIGFVPVWLLLVGRPEELGLVPDGGPAARAAGRDAAAAPPAARREPAFSRREALGTTAFWFLLLYTVLVYPVQAGVSLHQVAFLIERGIDPTIAATIVSTFALMSAVATVVCGLLPRAVPIRYPLAAVGAVLTLAVGLLLGVHSAPQGYLAAGLFGLAIGGLMTLLPIAWADYFGRQNFGAIRGVALPAQVLAQAAGPLLSGALHDLTGSYAMALRAFAVLGGLSVMAALLARPPTEPVRRAAG